MKLINNKDNTLLDELKNSINEKSEVYIACSYLTIPSLFELVNEFNKSISVKVLIDYSIDEEKRFVYDELEYKNYLELNSIFKSNTIYNLIKDKFQIRRGNVGGQKFIIVKNDIETLCFSIVPFDLNLVTLGKISSNLPLIISCFEDQNSIFLNLFNQFWDISSRDVKDELLSKINDTCKPVSPDNLYKYSLFQIFKDSVVNDSNEDRINKIGFKQTTIWSMLFNFQKDAVLGAIDKIETYGGCIIADSVGLGKTFEALAVMKYYQMRNDRILVLAPKKLRDNWLLYSQNDIQNILSKDRFNFDVLNHTDLSREGGMSGNINLETINWGNYDLIVIDESHNFRNNEPRRGTITRYQRLMNDIIKTGVKTKVLMLSATPVNTRMNDIKNQIAFITEQNDNALSLFGVNSIEQTLKKAQAKFNSWLKTSSKNNTNRDSLINGLDGSYFKLLDLLTIARSRKHIQKYYNVSDIGKFPERLAPINKHTDFDRNGSLKAMDKVNDELNALNLGFYSPLSYVRDDKKKDYEAKYDFKTSKGSVFKQIERENSLIHLMRVNLLKRLESSVYSFGLTIEALLKQINSLLSKIEKTKSEDYFEDDININFIDTDNSLLEDLLTGGKVKVLLRDMDLVKCKEDLLDDKKRLENLLSQTKVIDHTRDLKLNELKELIKDKIHNPLNNGNKKIIVFSAFSDTVNYLYDHIAEWAKKELNIYSAQIVGGNNANKTNLISSKSDFNHILINFSPISKNRGQILTDIHEEIDILICTDCISEGQNLQDCDFLVNYDIHWNPVRIIQRFGRIDRIGSKNDKIQLVNFFPNLELDTYIDLIARVKGRMQILDVSATGDDNIIEEQNDGLGDLEYRKRQLKSMQSKVLDLEDIEGGISITDLTFNDFKIDIERLSNEEKFKFENDQKSLFSIVKNNLEEVPNGVVFCFKTLKETKNNNNYNALYPYFLCYISENQEVFLTLNYSKKSLDVYKKLCYGQTELLSTLFEMFNKETNNSKNMNKYKELLNIALTHIKGEEDEYGIDTLASPGGTKINKEINKDYELVSYLIVK